MATSAEQPKVYQFETEPFAEQYSHILGNMQLYAPDAPPAEWGNLPWCITAEKGWEPGDEGLRYIVKPAHAQEAWKHIALVQFRPEWHA